MRASLCLLAIVAIMIGLIPIAIAEDELPPAADRTVDFDQEIRPILVERCLACHGPEQRKGGFHLEERESLLAGGDSGPAAEVGQSEESILIEKVAGLDPVSVMPPKGERLTSEQIGLLRAWIDQGAIWKGGPLADESESETHWAFQKPKRSESPEVHNQAWPRNPVDRFVLARLEKEGLAPSPEADRATLIRRLSLDLTGLPPSPEEVEAFVRDQAPGAYERLVNRMLDSPHYGERWARQWLDLARYADTNGYEKDRDRSIWPYRDWVIQALNADMPFDQFTTWQLAGDLLPDATIDQRTATGFHRNTMINEEGGIDVAEFRYASVVDRVDTTGRTWLGLTIGCAQCHTHKFDPITQREYYQFFAFLNNSDEPELALPDPAIQARRDEIQSQIEAIRDDLPNRFPVSEGSGGWIDHLRTWESSIQAFQWTPIAPTRVVSRKEATMTVLDDRSVLVSGDMPNNDVYELELPITTSGVTAIRIEALPHESLPDGGPGRAPLYSVGDFILTEIEVTLPAGDGVGPPRSLTFQNASEDYAQENHSAALAIDGEPDTGWAVRGQIGQPHAAVFELAEPIGPGEPVTLHLNLHQFGIHQMTLGRFRVSVTNDPRPVRASGVPAEVESALLVPVEERSEAQEQVVREHFLAIAPELKEQHEAIANLQKAMPRFVTTLVMQERSPEHHRPTYLYRRGEFLSPTDPVEPGVPAVLPPLPEGATLSRLTLARWLVDRENPLTARVTVNRAWASFFGLGIVPTLDDFGTRGEAPSHPELLDWLAVEFMENGWSLKDLHRLIVTSATYRQSSKVGPELLERDPQNRLLARGPRFRVDAETVRDIALAASGQLVRQIGGPSVYPPQPDGATSLAYGAPSWPTDTGPSRYRRGLYTFLKRTAPYAAFITFDAPTSEAVCTRRERSNTPLQALTLLNDTVFAEAAQAMARRLVQEAGPSPESWVQRAFWLCLSRAPDAEEMAAVLEFYQAQRDRCRDGSLDAEKILGPEAPEGLDQEQLADLAALTTVARAILNLDETISKE